MYPTKEEFDKILLSRNLDSILEEFLFAGVPFSFTGYPSVYRKMIRELTRGLRVHKYDICVVGSASIGFSLSPLNYGAPFSKYSDIDLVVVSSTLFDQSWVDILTSRRAPWSTLRQETRLRMREHQEKHHIYNGWIYPHLIAEALDIGEQWLTTFNGLSRIPKLSSMHINGRLYRTWDHVKVYHRRGLRQIRQRIVRSAKP